MKLITIHPPVEFSMPGLSPRGTIAVGRGQFEQWRVDVRGPSIFLTAPADFGVGEPVSEGHRRVYELPRAECRLVWDVAAGEKVEDAQKWSAPPVIVDAKKGGAS